MPFRARTNTGERKRETYRNRERGRQAEIATMIMTGKDPFQCKDEHRKKERKR